LAVMLNSPVSPSKRAFRLIPPTNARFSVAMYVKNTVFGRESLIPKTHNKSAT